MNVSDFLPSSIVNNNNNKKRRLSVSTTPQAATAEVLLLDEDGFPIFRETSIEHKPPKRRRSIACHPYFAQHDRSPDPIDDSVDTSTLNYGIFLDSDHNYSDQEEEYELSPSLMPDQWEITRNSAVSGDAELDRHDTLLRGTKRKDNSRDHKNKEDEMDTMRLLEHEKRQHPSLTNGQHAEQSTLTKQGELDIDDGSDVGDELGVDDGLDIDYGSDESDYDDADPPSPTSPRDPEREGPALSEYQEESYEGAAYRLETDPNFQDEAGPQFGEYTRDIFPDDEGMDPLENY